VAGLEVLGENCPGGTDELGERGGLVDDVRVGREAAGADVIERGEQQLGDRAEVVEDQSLVAAGATCDLTRVSVDLSCRPPEVAALRGPDVAMSTFSGGVFERTI
jgi:hypothetical protein